MHLARRSRALGNDPNTEFEDEGVFFATLGSAETIRPRARLRAGAQGVFKSDVAVARRRIGPAKWALVN